ncbi:uncharacterized protein LOC110685264 [Chenopodium quinoa]|uniref:uncharacterized protein LOC110685264 n=1 Tax=Chenopodium quinoa TaxID=63459 RepID=UPI000B799B08|nr:uncharacterized protein LOC110685264 [Chenopodium quinoa]
MKKLRHYLQAHTTYLVLRFDPIKYIFEKPILSERITRWHEILSKFDIKCVNQNSVKGRAISEALPDGPISGDEFDGDFLDKNIICLSTSQWKMHFDEASNRRSNACIYGIKAALGAGAKHLMVYDDSYLKISQTIKVWKVRDERLQMYTEYLQQFIPYFEEIEFKHLPREQNSFTDALANLAVNLTWDDDIKVKSVMIVEKEILVVNFEPTIALLTKEDNEDA